MGISSVSASALLILGILNEGFVISKEIELLAKRVMAGDTITDEEIKEAQAGSRAAVAEWDAAGETAATKE